MSGTIYGMSNDLALEIARMNVGGSEPFYSLGEYSATAGDEDHVIWSGGAWAVPPSGGVQMSIVSTSANDTALGTGIRTIDVHYLDIDLNPQIEVITLNGTTPVLTVATDIRFIQCMHLLTAGTSKKAEGTISAYVLTQVYGEIPQNKNRCPASVRMVPKGKRAIIMGIIGSSISGTAAAKASIKLASTWFEPHNYTDVGILIPYEAIGEQDSSESFNFPVPLVFPEGSVIAMTVSVDKNALITGSWYGWLENAQ